MKSIKHKLLSLYLLDTLQESERINPLKKYKQTALRQFINSIGLDWKVLNGKQKIKWANTKRYKDFKKLMKIKKIADEANIEETFIFEHYNTFMQDFIDCGDDSIINEEEVLSFLEILKNIEESYLLESVSRIKIYRQKMYKNRGSYRNKSQRTQAMRAMASSAINRGASISTGEGDVMFRGGKRHAQRALGSGKIMIKRKVKSSPGFSHRKTFRVY